MQHCSIYHNQYMESQNQNYITIVMIVYIILFSFSTDRMIRANLIQTE
jgi:hypothetical protein